MKSIMLRRLVEPTMTIFAILMPTAQPNLVAEIEKSFADHFLKINDTQYLISSKGTAVEISAKLGIFDAKEPTKIATGNAIIFSTTAYFGRAPTNVWDWMKVKLEAVPNG